MSGTLGGRTPVASSAAPTATLRPIISDALPYCPCADGVPQEGVNNGGGTSFGPGQEGGDTTIELCTNDMLATVTVGTDLNSYLDSSGGNQYVVIGARLEFGGGGNPNASDDGYFYQAYIYSGNQGLWPDCTWELFGPGPTTLATTTASHPVATDVLSIETVGSLIVCKRNGSTMFSVTDTSVTDGFYGGWLGFHGFGSGSMSDFSTIPAC